MSPELTKELLDKYPLIFKGRKQGLRRSLMGFGFEHGDGWYPVLDVLFGLMYSDLRQAQSRYDYLRENEGKSPSEGAQPVTAIDVERARLAMSRAAEAIPEALQVKEKFGALRVYLNRTEPTVAAYVTFAEAMSACTCEECGAPGRRRSGGWIRTLCDTHAKDD